MNVLIAVFITAVLVLFSGSFNRVKISRYVGILGLLISLYISFLPDSEFWAIYDDKFLYNKDSALFTKISIVSTILIFFLGRFAFSRYRKHESELYALMLFSLCGGIILFSFRNLVTLFLGIEILSIPVYVLAGSNKTSLYSIEASVKYFLMGAFATGFLLFGIAIVYGSSGSFDLDTIYSYSIKNGENPLFLSGMFLILCSMAFKVALAPFHTWSPDVYQGSPSLNTAFMASVVKISGFYAFFRIMVMGFAGNVFRWLDIVAVMIIITLIIAGLMGLSQNNTKRMLAYSSISHAGYISLIFFGTNNLSVYILAFYLFAYSLSTIGVFMCLIWVEKIKRDTSYEAFRGLAKTEPLLALVVAISLLSMAGIPFTAGFMGKFNIFSQVLDSGGVSLVIIAILGSALSIAYYLRLIIAMFFYNEGFRTGEKVNFTYNIVAILIITIIIATGIFPDIFYRFFRG